MVHYILKVDKILLKEKYHNAILNGVTRYNFPPVPTNFGFRDSMHFFEAQFSRPLMEDVPKKEVELSSVRYAADRVDDKVKFTDEAIKPLVKVPRVFLGLVLKGCVKWAKEHNITLITEKEMEIINEERKKNKGKIFKNKNFIFPIVALCGIILSFIAYKLFK